MKRFSFVVVLAAALLLSALVVSAQSDATPEPAAFDMTVSPATNADWTPQTQVMYDLALVWVPPGTFTMGTTEDAINLLFADCEQYSPCTYEWFSREAPQAQIELPGYWISQTEITNAQYRACVDAGACTPPSDPRYYDDPAFDAAPVVYVTWNQALEYAGWLSPNGDVRLPNEAEWEYAARGVDSLIYTWGNEFDAMQLNYCDSTCPSDSRDFDSDDGYPELAPVGSYPSGASWVGALDMAGNVREWTVTQYHETMFLYPYDPSDGRNEIVIDRNEARIVRGGSWSTVSRDVRTATRGVSPFPMDGENDIGFRVVIDAAA